MPLRRATKAAGSYDGGVQIAGVPLPAESVVVLADLLVHAGHADTAAKILQAARNEVDNKLKSARKELTEYAGQLASERAEALLRERITDNDKAKLFSDSLSQIEGAR